MPTRTTRAHKSNPAQPVQSTDSHTQLNTHTHSIAHRKSLLAETVEWRELKAQKGKKFEYFHSKPSWLEPSIPHYFTGKEV